MTAIDALIARLEALEAAATNGPWIPDTKERIGENWLIGCLMELGEAETADGNAYANWIVTTNNVPCSHLNGGDAETDAAFIAASREAIPALIAEVRRLRDEIAAYQDCVERIGGIASGPGNADAALTAISMEVQCAPNDPGEDWFSALEADNEQG